jgi:DNA-directed RNA polymerase specialized sigma24 family protein
VACKVRRPPIDTSWPSFLLAAAPDSLHGELADFSDLAPHGGVVRHHTKNARVADVAVNREMILEAVRRLSAQHRAVICRAYYESCTTAQIAAELHIDEDMVRSRLHHGLRALLHSVQECGLTRNWLQ